jgi:hypothetical protein
VLALLYNINRNPKSNPLAPKDFDPHTERKPQTKVTGKEGFAFLRAAFAPDSLKEGVEACPISNPPSSDSKTIGENNLNQPPAK